MDKKKFELKMKDFFEKAGVILLKKSEQYKGGEEIASYILLDHKRKSFYLAESDVLDKNDTELNEIALYFIKNYQIPENLAKAILRLGRAGLFYSDDFTVSEADLVPMIRKSALIINEENADIVTEFLKRRSVNFQAVPYKGEFLVMFMDRGNSKKIASLYHKVSDEYLKSSSGSGITEIPSGEPLQLEQKIDRTIRENKMLFDIDRSDIVVTDKKNERGEERDESLFHRPEVVKKETQLPETMSSDFLEELSQNEKDALNFAIKRDLPNNKATHSNENPYDKQKEKIVREEPNKTEHLIKPPAKSANIVNEEKASPASGYMFYKIMQNMAGIIFFLPAYVLQKVTFKKIPPFIVYWVASLIIFFGFYQLIFNPLGDILYGNSLENAKNTAVYASGLWDVSGNAAPAEAASGSIMTSALVYFIGEIYMIDAARLGLILKYFLSFCAFLMIFPLTRKCGSRLTVFFILLYFTTPFLLYIQTHIISGAASGSLEMIKLALASNDKNILFSAVASAVTFAVYALPVTAIVVLYIASGFITPYRNENTNIEVIP